MQMVFIKTASPFSGLLIVLLSYTHLMCFAGGEKTSIKDAFVEGDNLS